MAATMYDGVHPPASFGPMKRRMWARGFAEASHGASRQSGPERVVNPDRPWIDSWQFTAWITGFDAYHAWLQQNRVRACDRPTPAAPRGATPEAP